MRGKEVQEGEWKDLVKKTAGRAAASPDTYKVAAGIGKKIAPKLMSKIIPKFLGNDSPKTLDEMHQANIEGKLPPEKGFSYGVYSFVYFDNLWYTQLSTEKSIFNIPFHSIFSCF